MANNLFYRKRTVSVQVIVVVCFLLLLIFGIFKLFSAVVSSSNENKTKGTLVKKEKVKKTMANDRLGNMPTWDLSDLYAGFDDEKLADDIKKIDNDITDLANKYQNKIRYLDSPDLFAALVSYEGVMELMDKIASYAHLKFSEDSSKTENKAFYQKMTELISDYASRLVFFDLELNNISNARIRFLLAKHKNLKKYYGAYIEKQRLFKPHQLSLAVEKLMNDKGVTGRQGWVRLYDETLDNMVFNFDGKELNQSELLQIMNGANKKDRKRAGKIFGEGLAEKAELIAYITNILAKDKGIDDQWRSFEAPISSMNLYNEIEGEVVEALRETVKKNYGAIAHRYYGLKAKMLGQDKLHYTDRNAPIAFGDGRSYSYGEAVNIVRQAYNSFSPAMAEVGELFFSHSWIDAPTRVGKRSGAFMAPTVPSVHPYILLNYQGGSRDVMTLAHELGHGIHQYLSKDQGYFMSNTPLILAETASVFGEQLTFRWLLNNETNIDNRIAIIATKIEDMINTVVRQIAFLEFETKVHAERANGELPLERLNEIWMEVQKESLGDIFEYEEEYKYYWSYISHFIHSPFYVYSYAFGDCLVNSLYHQYQENPDGFADKYVEMLKAGGSKRYDVLLKEFNLDPKNPSFWQGGLNMIIELIDELEKLLEAR